jgi:hypothetical protein
MQRVKYWFSLRNLLLENSLILNEIEERGSAVVKALCYKPEGRGFETR